MHDPDDAWAVGPAIAKITDEGGPAPVRVSFLMVAAELHEEVLERLALAVNVGDYIERCRELKRNWGHRAVFVILADHDAL
jgi:hypothetical protein